ncbi:MAG: hypothetical protein U0414_18355 [Polyangiaceae bacterium]
MTSPRPWHYRFAFPGFAEAVYVLPADVPHDQPWLPDDDVPLDGLVLVRVHFDLKAGPKAKSDDVISAAQALYSLIGRASWPSWVFTTNASVPFPKLLVVFQFGFGIFDTPAPPNVTARIELPTSAQQSDLLLPNASKPAALRFRPAEATWAVVRYAIGLESAAPDATGAMVALDGPLALTELVGSSLERAIQTLAGDAATTTRTWRAQP